MRVREANRKEAAKRKEASGLFTFHGKTTGSYFDTEAEVKRRRKSNVVESESSASSGSEEEEEEGSEEEEEEEEEEEDEEEEDEEEEEEKEEEEKETLRGLIAQLVEEQKKTIKVHEECDKKLRRVVDEMAEMIPALRDEIDKKVCSCEPLDASRNFGSGHPIGR